MKKDLSVMIQLVKKNKNDEDERRPYSSTDNTCCGEDLLDYAALAEVCCIRVDGVDLELTKELDCRDIELIHALCEKGKDIDVYISASVRSTGNKIGEALTAASVNRCSTVELSISSSVSVDIYGEFVVEEFKQSSNENFEYDIALSSKNKVTQA